MEAKNNEGGKNTKEAAKWMAKGRSPSHSQHLRDKISNIKQHRNNTKDTEPTPVRKNQNKKRILTKCIADVKFQIHKLVNTTH